MFFYFFLTFRDYTSDILIFNQHKELLSSNDPSFFKKEKKEETKKILTQIEKSGTKHKTVKNAGEIRSYQIQQFQNTNYKMLGILKPEAAFEEQYDFKGILLITLLITAIVSVILWYFVRKQIHPLYQLVNTVSRVREGHLQEYVNVNGTVEIQQLSKTYNDMMKEINQYVEKIYHAESEKRKAEIHALQMQINPHYVYNTLSSIKWLVWQGEKEKVSQIIESFISLLRNTISNTDEFITVEQEIDNLKNYVLINQVRYGENIKAEFFVGIGCEQYKVPKLILQPFVENAFFHAFPEGRTGIIHVFVRKNKDKIQFEITDNGVGITQEKLLSLNEKESQKSRHFTGIGVSNVDNRIKMIYGLDYGIHIKSEENKGTTVTVLLPVNHDQKKGEHYGNF